MNDIPEHPIPNSYWAVPNKLVAGEYPASRFSDDLTRHNLSKLLEAGVSFFLNLTQPGELVSYEKLLMGEAKRWDKLVEHRQIPIRDRNCPSKEIMIEILDTIDGVIKKRRVVYLHCWGGIGRTGTVVGCHLVRHGMAGREALLKIESLRAETPSGWLESPETDEQCEMVLSWGIGM